MKKENKNNFCCDTMEHYVKKHFVEYSKPTRSYSFTLPDCAESIYGTHQSFWHCPWCGTKLPKDLDDEWFSALEQEHGIKDPIFDDKDKVPDEFKDERWWKKRGL